MGHGWGGCDVYASILCICIIRRNRRQGFGQRSPRVRPDRVSDGYPCTYLRARRPMRRGTGSRRPERVRRLHARRRLPRRVHRALGFLAPHRNSRHFHRPSRPRGGSDRSLLQDAAPHRTMRPRPASAPSGDATTGDIQFDSVFDGPSPAISRATRSASAWLATRTSTSARALAAITFARVPPLTTPTLTLVPVPASVSVSR